MEIILNSDIASLTGKLDNTTGYCIRRRGKRFFSYRMPCGNIRYDLWRFINQCATLAYCKQYIDDILIKPTELWLALRIAHHFVAADNVKHDRIYNARDIINLKITFGL